MFRDRQHDDYSSLPLAKHQDAEDEIDSESFSTEKAPSPGRSRAARLFDALKNLLAIGFLIQTSICVWLVIHMAKHSESTPNLDKECAAHTTQFSTLLKEVDVKYSWQHFNGSFMQENIYRQPASSEVDAAWEDLGVDFRAGIIPAEDGPASGLSSYHVQRAEKYGGGFVVNVEGMHHLHCLNLLRKSLYFNYQHYKEMGMHAFKNDEHILQLHITHCLDIIRQVLMCNVDTAVLGQVWVSPETPQAFPDFNTKHKCKNYDEIKKWAGEMQSPPPDSVPHDYLKPPGLDDIFPYTP